MPELIDILWDGRPEAWYLKGHWPEAEAIAAVKAQVDEEDEDEDTRFVMTAHRHARWIPNPPGDEYALRFECPVPAGRGAFPVTIVEDGDRRDYDLAHRAAQAAHGEALQAFILEWFPGATVVRVHSFPVGEGFVIFRLPSLQHTLLFTLKSPDTVSVLPCDLEAFQALPKAKRPPLGDLLTPFTMVWP